MKKILWWVFAFAMLGAIVSSCKDDEDEVSDQVSKVRKNKEDGEAYLKEKGSKTDVLVDPSGLLYSIVTKGDGERPGVNDTVIITYTGKTIRDSVFVSMTETIAVADLTEGLQIGVRHMPEGSNYKLYIPYYLMYGSSSTTFKYEGKNITVMPYSALIYDMKLDAVIKTE